MKTAIIMYFTVLVKRHFGHLVLVFIYAVKYSVFSEVEEVPAIACSLLVFSAVHYLSVCIILSVGVPF